MPSTTKYHDILRPRPFDKRISEIIESGSYHTPYNTRIIRILDQWYYSSSYDSTEEPHFGHAPAFNAATHFNIQTILRLPFESQLCRSHLRFFVRSSLRGSASATPVASSASRKHTRSCPPAPKSACASDITKTHPQLLTKRLCLRREAWRPSS